MFERESHREKILEARAKEMRIKAKQKALAESGPAEPAVIPKTVESAENPDKSMRDDNDDIEDVDDSQLSPDELLKKIEREFFDQIEEEKKRWEQENNERTRHQGSLDSGEFELEEKAKDKDGEEAIQNTVNGNEEEVEEEAAMPSETEDVEDAET